MLFKLIGILISVIAVICFVKMINCSVVWMYKAIVSANKNDSLDLSLKDYKRLAVCAYAVLSFLSKFIIKKNKKFISFFVIVVCFVEIILLSLAIIGFCNYVILLVDIVLYVQVALDLFFLFLFTLVDTRDLSQLIEDITIKISFLDNERN